MKKGKYSLDFLIFFVIVIGVTLFFKTYMPFANAFFVGLALGSSGFVVFWCIKEYLKMLMNRHKTA